MIKIDFTNPESGKEFSAFLDNFLNIFNEVNRNNDEYGVSIHRYYDIISVKNEKAGWIINIDGPDDLLDVETVLGSFYFYFNDLVSIESDGMNSITFYFRDYERPYVTLYFKPTTFDSLLTSFKEKRIKNLKKRILENKN